MTAKKDKEEVNPLNEIIAHVEEAAIQLTQAANKLHGYTEEGSTVAHLRGLRDGLVDDVGVLFVLKHQENDLHE